MPDSERFASWGPVWGVRTVGGGFRGPGGVCARVGCCALQSVPRASVGAVRLRNTTAGHFLSADWPTREQQRTADPRSHRAEEGRLFSRGGVAGSGELARRAGPLCSCWLRDRPGRGSAFCCWLRWGGCRRCFCGLCGFWILEEFVPRWR